jgi:hypothetical protein
MNIRNLIKDVQSYRAIARKGLGDESLQVLALEKTEHIGHLRHAQRLHASVYLKRGFIQAGDISEDGRLTLYADPHQEHAEYFIVHGQDGERDIRAVSRQIRMHPDKGFESFPILDLAHVQKRYVKMIMGYDPATCVEISALSKRSGESSLLPLALYRVMLHTSVANGDKLWLMACDVRLYQRLKLLFGTAITRIGSDTPYYGGDVAPAMVKLDEVLGALIAGTKDKVPIRRSIRKSLPRFFLTGYPEKYVTLAQRKELVRIGVVKK